MTLSSRHNVRNVPANVISQKKIVVQKALVPRKLAEHSVRSLDELPPDDAVLREFVSDFYAAMSLMRNVRRALARTVNLSSAEWSVMLAVWYLQRNGDTTVRDIANHLHVAAAHMTAEIGKLVNAGLLVKRAHPTDGRAVGIHMTKAAEDMFRRIAPILREVNDDLFVRIPYADMVIVHRFLRRIIDQAPAAISIAEGYVTDDKAN
jgi:DNA-binding MarR family transcriptional regulator